MEDVLDECKSADKLGIPLILKIGTTKKITTVDIKIIHWRHSPASVELISDLFGGTAAASSSESSITIIGSAIVLGLLLLLMQLPNQSIIRSTES